jgi:hypothetical protein
MKCKRATSLGDVPGFGHVRKGVINIFRSQWQEMRTNGQICR